MSYADPPDISWEVRAKQQDKSWPQRAQQEHHGTSLEVGLHYYYCMGTAGAGNWPQALGQHLCSCGWLPGEVHPLILLKPHTDANS